MPNPHASMLGLRCETEPSTSRLFLKETHLESETNGGDGWGCERRREGRTEARYCGGAGKLRLDGESVEASVGTCA
jgi:hypothetical protein